MVRKCPRCRLVNPPEARRCDCGYDFTSRRVEQSYLTERDWADAEKRSNRHVVGCLAAMLSAAVGVVVSVWIELYSGIHDGDPHGYSFLFITPFTAFAGAVLGSLVGLGLTVTVPRHIRRSGRPSS